MTRDAALRDQTRSRAARPRFGPAALLMNLTVYPLMALWTLLGIAIFPLIFPGWKVVTGWGSDRIMRHLIWLYGRGWLLLMSPFVRFRREGLTVAGIRPPAILIVNHRSFFDTYCMALLPVYDITFAVRAWPFRMFWYGGFMRLARYLDVENLSWEECVAAGRRVFAAHGFLLFFPEGHRSRDGRLQRFYGGAFKLARETGVPVIPLCITGTDVFLPPGRFWLQPARVTLRALPPVHPSQFPGPSGHLDLRRFVRNRMVEQLNGGTTEQRPTRV